MTQCSLNSLIFLPFVGLALVWGVSALAGAAGKRMSLQCRIYDSSSHGAQGQAVDIEIQRFSIIGVG